MLFFVLSRADVLPVALQLTSQQPQGGLGGWVFSRVGGSKALDPAPLIIPRVSWVVLLPHLLSLVTGALFAGAPFCCVVVQVAGVQVAVFHMVDFSLITC